MKTKQGTIHGKRVCAIGFSAKDLAELSQGLCFELSDVRHRLVVDQLFICGSDDLDTLDQFCPTEEEPTVVPEAPEITN